MSILKKPLEWKQALPQHYLHDLQLLLHLRKITLFSTLHIELRALLLSAEWKMKYEEAIKARDEASEKKHQEILQKASLELEEFYKQYHSKLQQKQKNGQDMINIKYSFRIMIILHIT